MHLKKYYLMINCVKPSIIRDRVKKYFNDTFTEHWWRLGSKI